MSMRIKGTDFILVHMMGAIVIDSYFIDIKLPAMPIIAFQFP